eukprot:gene20440-1082_t
MKFSKTAQNRSRQPPSQLHQSATVSTKEHVFRQECDWALNNFLNKKHLGNPDIRFKEMQAQQQAAYYKLKKG